MGKALVPVDLTLFVHLGHPNEGLKKCMRKWKQQETLEITFRFLNPTLSPSHHIKDTQHPVQLFSHF